MDTVESRVSALEQRSKSNTHRIDHLEQEQAAIHSLAATLQVMANEQKHQTEAIAGVKEDVGRLEGKVDVLEAKPGKRWEGIVDKLIWGVAGAVLAFILVQIGIG